MPEWNKILDIFLVSIGFTSSLADPSLYDNCLDVTVILIVVDVDDLFVTGNDANYMDGIVSKTAARFEILGVEAVIKLPRLCH